MGIGRYVKHAFLYHWNLLAVGAGLAFGMLSGHPDVVIPLVLAGEVAYLGMLGTHPKFQQHVDAQEAKAERDQETAGSQKTLWRLLGAMPRKQVERFESLRQRCLELRQIAEGLKSPEEEAAPSLDAMQLAGLDRLLWLHLRLLYTQYQLERFFARTSEDDITKDIRRLERELSKLGDGNLDEQQQKVKKTLEDNLATSKERLANYKKAQDNSQLVTLELDRLENKIQSLSEMAVNRQEPGYVSNQVDEVASGMVATERTMSELRFLTGLTEADETAPELVRRKTAAVKQ